MTANALSMRVVSAFTEWGVIFRSATGRVSWRVVATTAAIAAALELYVIFEFTVDGTNPGDAPSVPAAQVYLSGAVINFVMAFTLMLATFMADELVARGAKRRLAYPLAVVVGSAGGALLQRALHLWLHLGSRYDGAGIPPDITIMEPAVVFFEYLIWSSIIVFIYVNRTTALRAAARMNAAQVEQSRARRRTLEARLQALQARVEPQFLFNTLAKVRALYDDDRDKGSRLLEDLIVYLRAALPQLRDSTSTLERELELVTAYLAIMRVHMAGDLVIVIEGPPPAAARAAAFPPMILLPLVASVLAPGGLAATFDHDAVRLVARIDSGRLRVEVTASGGRYAAKSQSGVLSDIRERINALYGELGTLSVESSGTLTTGVVMEIPDERANGSHR